MRHKAKSTEKFSCVKEIKNNWQSDMRQRKEKLLTICHASNRKFYNNDNDNNYNNSNNNNIYIYILHGNVTINVRYANDKKGKASRLSKNL